MTRLTMVGRRTPPCFPTRRITRPTRIGEEVAGDHYEPDRNNVRDFTVPALPDIPEFHEWKTRLQHTVASATYYPRAALAWLHEVELYEIAQLGHSRRFERLDYILGEALI